MADANLIKQCQIGDAAGMDELYRTYHKKALGTAYLISDNRGMAEDIVQETFIRCFSDLKSLKCPETFDVWFYKILVRTGWKMVGKNNYYIPTSDENMETMSSSGYQDMVLEAKDTAISLGQAVEKLSPPLKTVVILHYYNDLSIKEISGVLGCFQGTVKSRLFNAKRQLYYELYGTFHEYAGKGSGTPLCKRKVLKINGERI